MINPHEIYDKLVIAGDDWADKNAAAEIIEETKKIELARLMNGLEGSHAAKEQQALCNPLYRAFLARMVDARKEANKAKVKYESAKMFAELLRTKAATERVANRSAT